MSRTTTRAGSRIVMVLGGLLLVLVVGAGSYLLLGRLAPGEQAGGERPKGTAARKAKPDGGTPSAERSTDVSIEIEKSGLHWVAVARMPFTFDRPMDVTQVDGQIFIVTNKGLLTYYDRDSQHFKIISEVEQNRDELRESEISESNKFALGNFRTFGLYVEKTDPDYTAYVGYHRFADDCFYFEIARLRFALGGDSARVVADWQPLFTAEPCIQPKDKGQVFAGHQAGGRIVPFDGQHLLVSIGDHELDGFSGPAMALDPKSPYGKIVLLDKDTGEWSIFAAGVRNPQGLLVAADGTIYETEHGPRGGDELNIIERGQSYGWPTNTYGILYGNHPWPPSPRQGWHDEGRRPFFVWLPSIAVSNLTQINDAQFPLWQDDLIVSTLKMQSLYRLRVEDGRVMYVEQIPVDHRIRDIETLDSGHLLATTDDGQLLIISDAGEMFGKPKSKREIRLELPLILAPADEAAVADAAGAAPVSAELGQEIFEDRCASCHRLDGEIEVSVPLDGLLGRRIGSVAGYDYSPALAKDKRRWSVALLKRFLIRREGRFAGTTMPKVSVSGTEVEALAAYLTESG